MRRLADGRVVDVQVAADRAHEHLAGIEPDTDRQRRPVGAAFAESPDGVLHRERRVARAYRVIFDGDRRPEERHDAVAHHLVHGAAVAAHGLDHPVEYGIEHRARVLGVARGQQLHRRLQIGEQHRHVLALAFESDPRADEGAGLGRGLAERRAARLAEPVIGRVRGGAARAGAGQGLAAAGAEAGAGGNDGTAVRAGHRTNLRRAWRRLRARGAARTSP